MRPRHLVARSLQHHWRMHLAVALGVAVGTSVLTGALIVGDSMRGSLRDLALDRLGSTDHAMIAPRFVLETLADRIANGSNDPQASPSRASSPMETAPDQGQARSLVSRTSAALGPARPALATEVCPLILLTGSATHSDPETRAGGLSVAGVDDRFWTFHGLPQEVGEADGDERTAVINEALAAELDAEVGDDIVLNTAKPSEVSNETLLGRRDESTASLRVTVRKIIPNTRVGSLALRPVAGQPRLAYVPLKVLQRSLHQRNRVNVLLCRDPDRRSSARPVDPEDLTRRLARAWSLEDLALTLRSSERYGYLALESEAVFLDAVVSRAAMRAAQDLSIPSVPLLAYLVNSITTDSVAEGVPYSTAVGIGTPSPASAASDPLQARLRGLCALARPGGIGLVAWAADDLAARVGDRVTLSYFVASASGSYETRSESFGVWTILPPVDLRAAEAGGSAEPDVAADPGLVPPYEGITDTENLVEWDAPFPINLSRIRKKDEEYWREHRTAPKAFLDLTDARRLWGVGPNASEAATAIRLYPPGLTDRGVPAGLADAFRVRVRERLAPADVGLRFEAVRDVALRASRGSTDFAVLFAGFSTFLIGSALMLSVLLFRLGIERRASDVGLLLAVGLSPGQVMRVLALEGGCAAVLGTLLGLAMAGGYATLMLAGLSTIWSAAASSPVLSLHIEPMTIVIGASGSTLLALATIGTSVRRFVGLPASRLLRGSTESSAGHRSSRVRSLVPVVCAGGTAAACALAGMQFDAIGRAGFFFGSGAATVCGFVLGLRAWLRYPQRRRSAAPVSPTLTRFAIRNLGRNPGRSLLIVGLVASSGFVLVAVDAFRLRAENDGTRKDSGTGGFTGLAEAATPLPFDLAQPANWQALDLTPGTRRLLSGASVVPFRLRPGDSTSCLNPYEKPRPRILGAPRSMVERGGFRFASTIPCSGDECANPWKLLKREFDDGSIAAIGDEASVLWQLKSGLGQTFPLTDERGHEVRLRFVGLLSNSILQGELIVLDSHFRRLFPSIEGQGFFLIQSPPGATQTVANALETDLARFGFDAQSATRRLSEFLAVQNTYLSTFQSLGGLGLVLGCLGLVTVLVRGVWERRRELALLQCLGMRRSRVLWYVLIENLVLLVYGLLAGFVSAAVAIVPGLLEESGSIPWVYLAWLSLGCFGVTLASGIPALYRQLASPVLPALRNE